MNENSLINTLPCPLGTEDRPIIVSGKRSVLYVIFFAIEKFNSMMNLLWYDGNHLSESDEKV